MEEIRLGTIGSGVIVHSILYNVMRTEGIRLCAVYSRSEEKARALAAQYGADRVYTDMDSFLKDDVINFVYIATPNLLHYEQTKKALLAGKNVICEKPFCTRSDQARELAALAKEKHLFLIDAVPTAFLPNTGILMRELPKIGPLRLVMGNYSQYSSRYDRLLAGETPNVFNPDFAGGCLMDINFYNIYLNVLLFGRPDEVTYTANLHGGKIDTSGIVMLRYKNFVSESAGAKDTFGVNFVEIEGEKGYIYIPGGPNGIASLTVTTKDSEETFNDQPDPDRWFYEIQEITRLVLADDYEAIYNRLAVMVNVIETLERARRSAGISFPGDN